MAAKLKPHTREALNRLGRERAIIYATMVYTGLRVNEIRTLTWGDLSLEGDVAWLNVRPENAKNRKAADLPIHPDLVIELRWLRGSRKTVGRRPANSASAGEPRAR